MSSESVPPNDADQSEPDAEASAEEASSGPAAPATTELIRDADPAYALVTQLRLYVTAGPDVGQVFVLGPGKIVIGSISGADVLLHDRTVSRFHAELFLDQNRIVLHDLGSRNGTFVDGVPVQTAYLRERALLTLGHSQLRVGIGPDQARIQLSTRSEFGLMVGSSIAMRVVFAELERAAQSDATVLLEGETGTGKEVAAESIHLESKRRRGPFVIMDCSAIPAELVESELFGHERGAFTGAVTSRKGAFAAASGGTLFVDEVGELSQELQPKLLRALERRQIRPVGSDKYQDVDVRVIAATNRNLHAEMNARRFRTDLYYRLAVLRVKLPPLRERREDLPQLVDRILESLGVDPSAAPFLHDPAFLAELARQSWSGNVRELRNHVERCLAFRKPVPHTAADEGAPDPPSPRLPLRLARERWNRTLERRYLEALLSEHKGNVSAAARGRAGAGVSISAAVAARPA